MPVREGGATDPPTRLDRLLAVHDRRFRQAFNRSIQTMLNSDTLEQLADLIDEGRLEDALRNLRAAGEVLGGQYGQTVNAAADDAARFLSTALTVDVQYDVSNDRAVANIRNNRLRLIREFTGEQRRATRAALQEGIERGLNPIDQARMFRQSIGLTERQVGTVNNFRRLLTTARQDGLPSRAALNRALRDGRFDRTILRSIRDNRPLTDTQVERMVGRYQERLIRHRSEVIARTESLRAVHEGNLEMYDQAVENEQIRADQVSRTWVTARDDQVRDTHEELNGQVRALDEVWETQNGVLRFPGDPMAPGSETIQCRCVVATRLSA